MSIEYQAINDTTYPNVKDGDGYISYEQFVTRTVAPMGDLQSNLAHMALGVCGEAGELADAIKKSFAYKKPLDMENVVEEMGDIEWYLAGMRQMLGIKRDDVIAQNVAKLRKRYPDNVFTQAAAIARADKEPVAEVAAQVIDVTSESYKKQRMSDREWSAQSAGDREIPGQ